MQMNEAKRLAFETLFDHRGRVRVLFDMTHESVRVPERAKKASPDGRILALDYSKRFNMLNFKVDDRGVSAVLTFGGASLSTFVPWEAVIGLGHDTTMVESWPVAPSQEAKATWLGEAEAEAEGDAKWMSRTVAEG